MELAVLTLSVVPAGIVAAFKDEATKHAQHVVTNRIIYFVSYWFEELMWSCVRNEVVSPDRCKTSPK
jgi:hypothetical protein